MHIGRKRKEKGTARLRMAGRRTRAAAGGELRREQRRVEGLCAVLCTLL